MTAALKEATVADESKPARRRRRTPAKRAEKVPVVIVPDSVDRQAAAALGRLQEAESRRPQSNGKPATASVTPLQQELRESRVPAQRRRTPKEVATEAEHEFDLDDALKKMNVDYIQCRDFGHSWAPHTARWVSASNAYEQQFRCTRCTTIRTRWLSRTGAQLQGQYDYAEGYLVKGMGRLTGGDRDKVRLRSILAVIK